MFAEQQDFFTRIYIQTHARKLAPKRPTQRIVIYCKPESDTANSSRPGRCRPANVPRIGTARTNPYVQDICRKLLL